MKKKIFAIAAAIIIPLFIAYILAKLMTPSAEQLFMKKMKAYLGAEDYYSEMLYKTSRGKFNVRQSKVKDNYYLIFDDNSGVELLLNIEDDKVYYGFPEMSVSVPKYDFENSKSVILFDKFSLDDIDKASISLDKKHRGLYYTFSLNNGTRYSVLFEKGKLYQLTAYGVEYLPHISQQAAEQRTGDVVIEYSQWRTPSDLSKVTKLSNESRIYSLDELANSGDETDSLKQALGLLDEYDEEDENFDDEYNEYDDYGDEEEEPEAEEHRDFEVLDF